MMNLDAYGEYHSTNLDAQTARASPIELVLVLTDGLLEELRELTWDAITVDDFDPADLQHLPKRLSEAGAQGVLVPEPGRSRRQRAGHPR